VPTVACNPPIVGDVRLSAYPVGVTQVYSGTPTAHVSDAADLDWGWRTVCGWHGNRQLQAKWDTMNLARVVCRQLGYSEPLAQSERHALFELDETLPYQCASGHEKSLTQCREVDLLGEECTSAVVVSCRGSGLLYGPDEPRCGSAGLLVEKPRPSQS